MPGEGGNTTRPSRGRAALEWLAVGLIFAALTTVVTWPSVPRLMTHAPEHHDALFNMWRLSWIAEALTTYPSRLFDPPIFHPATRVLAFSDAVLLQGLLATPWLAAGAPLLPVTNVVLLLGPWLSALGAYLLVRDLLPEGGQARGLHWPALVAGTIFGFLPYRIEHIMHLELQWSQWMPLACWGLHRTVRTGRVRDGVLTAVFVLGQFLSCIYYGVFLVLALAVSAPVLVLARLRTPAPTARAEAGTSGRDGQAPLLAITRAFLVGALVTIGPLLAYSAPYRANQSALGGRGAHEIARWSANPGAFLSTPPDNRLYGATATLGIPEGRLFPGITALVLACVAVWGLRRGRLAATVPMYVVMTVVSAVLAMGTNTPLYRVALALLPLLRGLRAPARFGMVFALGLAVLAAAGAATLLSRLPAGRRRHALGACLLAALTLEYASNVGPLHAWVQRPPLYARWLRQQPPGAVIDLPIARARSLPHYEAEWTFHGRTHRHPMVNGYSGYFPRDYIDLLGAMIEFPRGASLDALRRVGTRYVVVHEDRYEQADFLDFDGRLRRTPGIRFLAHVPDPDYPVSIYTLEP
ncbi:hypothetical protein [Luteitalea sp. TBR-22]|uniref:hypothetical protein n=1 Tax=Luteitalea sp. TBR-22 TaxID=2802971 RepID=UPI001EF3EA1B|nr:hypothetical protein [Luteitalea sp. TBR-22]